MCEVLLEAKSNISVTHRSHVSQVYGDCNLKNLHHSRSSSTTRKLNLYYQEVENARLSKRINNIQCRGVKNSTYMNEMTVRSKCCSLPPINQQSSRLQRSKSQLKLINVVEIENKRLKKKLKYLKMHKSQYFDRIIGLGSELRAKKLRGNHPKSQKQNIVTGGGKMYRLHGKSQAESSNSEAQTFQQKNLRANESSSLNTPFHNDSSIQS